MLVSIEINNRVYKVDAKNALDISIPLDFYGAQPNAFDVERATAKTCETGDFIGDTRRGGSCNFEEYKFIPHCNGTHTECVGHITNARMSVHECLKDSFVPAALISIASENAGDSNETYSADIAGDDKLITRKNIETALNIRKSEFQNTKFEALIVRTLPNDKSKLTKTYFEEIPPFFTTEAMNYIVELKIKHLLADVPSVDRIFDGGVLSNHRKFWNIEREKFELNANSLVNNTITEMIYAPDAIRDGAYLLNLQIAAFASDASPSRPRLFELFPL